MTTTTLEKNLNLITGIYNYCDRWCERCPFASRCLLFQTEDETAQTTPPDRQAAEFWNRLETFYHFAQDLIPEWKLAAPPVVTEPLTGTYRTVDTHPLARAAKRYAASVSSWFDSVVSNDADAAEVIHWYQYQIAVKFMRALSSAREDDGASDADGSAKVSLIGIDRSIAAWRLIQLATPERAESIIPLILLLDHLRERIEEIFPNARMFVRAGFDGEVPATPEPEPETREDFHVEVATLEDAIKINVSAGEAPALESLDYGVDSAVLLQITLPRNFGIHPTFNRFICAYLDDEQATQLRDALTAYLETPKGTDQ